MTQKDEPRYIICKNVTYISILIFVLNSKMDVMQNDVTYIILFFQIKKQDVV